MLYISHRGNIHGPNPYDENKPDYILNTIKKGYQCEIDIWNINDKLYLGHDKPDTPINKEFLINNRDVLWIHCKNLEAISYIKKLPYQFNYFFHDKDTYTLTSTGYIWGNINSELNSDVICVMPELYNFKINISNCKGICSDFIESYNNY